jgi:hypothetical protein
LAVLSEPYRKKSGNTGKIVAEIGVLPLKILCDNFSFLVE